MSHKKNKDESLRWLKTGKDDLDTAIILKDNKKYAHSCFHVQQAVEKFVKSIWYYFDEDPWGHSIFKLIKELEPINKNVFSKLAQFIDDARKLDRLYIPTRYPNGLPDITPDMAYSENDSLSSIDSAKKILKAVELIINI